MIRVLVSGSGKMGRAIVDALVSEHDLEAVGAVDKLADGTKLSRTDGAAIPLFDSAAGALDATKPDVVIDFTNAAWTPELTKEALPRGVRPVIGTSGLSQAYVDALADQCRERKVGGVLAANFALGAILLMHMSRIASKYFDAAEIIELHHDQKVDAPSGTAIATARGRPFGRNQPDATPVQHSRDAEIGGVTLHSVRLPGMVAHQEVIFGGLGQTLSIRHDTTGRESFMPGIILATREVMKRTDLAIGLDALLGL